MQDKLDELVNLGDEVNKVCQAILVCLVCQETLGLLGLNQTSNPSWNKSSSLKEAKKDHHQIRSLTCKLK